MNIINLQRDQCWVDPEATGLTFPTVSSRANSDGVVNSVVGRMVVNNTTDASATGTSVGVMIQQPLDQPKIDRVVN